MAPELLDLLPRPVDELAGAPLARAAAPGATACRDRRPSQHGRRALTGWRWRHGGTWLAVRASRRPGSCRSATPTSSAAAGVPAAWPATGRVAAGRPARPRRAHRRHRRSRTPTTTPTGRSPGARPRPSPVAARRHPGQPRRRVLRRGRRRAGAGRRRSGRRGVPTVQSATSPAGASSASTPTCSARPSTTTGSRPPWPTDRPVLVFVHQPVAATATTGGRCATAPAPPSPRRRRRRRARGRQRPPPLLAPRRAAAVWAPSLTLHR